MWAYLRNNLAPPLFLIYNCSNAVFGILIMTFSLLHELKYFHLIVDEAVQLKPVQLAVTK